MRRIGLLILITFLLAACGGVRGDYSPPAARDYTNSVSVTKGYDDAWEDLIAYTSQSFFSIDNFEKDSGLLTLSFGADRPSRYIDCGAFQATGSGINFNGSYVDFLQQYNGAELDGKMNLRVRRMDALHTEVTVNARYLFSTPASVVGSGRYAQTIPANNWVFDSRSQATVSVTNAMDGTNNTRTCQPTGLAEREILQAVQR